MFHQIMWINNLVTIGRTFYDVYQYTTFDWLTYEQNYKMLFFVKLFLKIVMDKSVSIMKL